MHTLLPTVPGEMHLELLRLQQFSRFSGTSGSGSFPQLSFLMSSTEQEVVCLRCSHINANNPCGLGREGRELPG